MSSLPLKEYLKKYMSKDEVKKKKRKKVKNSKLTIHDEDEVVAPAFKEDEFPESDEDDPQIVEIGPKVDYPIQQWSTIDTLVDEPDCVEVKQEALSPQEVTNQPKRGRFGDDDDMSPLRKVKEEQEDMVDEKPTQVIFRDRKSLKKKDIEEERIKNEEKKQREEEISQKYSLWGLGMKQVSNRLEENKYDRREVKKPLARSKDDVDLNKEQQKKLFEEDPMLKFMSTEEKKPQLGQKWENRYGIEPGKRWDGVDRSNGYERRYLQNMADKVAIKAVAYRIRTDDM